MDSSYKLSACMIVKNEQADLPICLSTAKDFADEIVIVDTGSTDNTVDIARQHGASIFHEPWKNDFALARNVSIQHATGDWLMWIDADNYVPPEQVPKINAVKSIKPDHVIATKEVTLTSAGRRGQVLTQLRIFPKHPKLFFEGKIHERISSSVKALGLKVVPMDIEVMHRAYENPQRRNQKVQRNIRIMEAEVACGNTSPYLLYKYAGQLQDLGKLAHALELCQQVIDATSKHQHHASLCDSAYIKAVEILMNQQQFDQAIHFLKEHRRRFGVQLENTCYYGVALYFKGQIDQATDLLDQATHMHIGPYPTHAIDENLVKVNAYKYLGKIYSAAKDMANLQRVVDKIKYLCPPS